MSSLLPPNATPAEIAIEGAMVQVFDVPVPIADLWHPETCPANLLPWLAWGLSVNIWSPDWTEAEKRAAIAEAVPDQAILGSRAAVEAVLARLDEAITIVEWWEHNPRREPGTFSLHLPLPEDSAVSYSDAVVSALLRDIAAVKPLSAHLDALFQIRAATSSWLAAGGRLALFTRLDMTAGHDPDPAWATYLQAETGEPLQAESGLFLETI